MYDTTDLLMSYTNYKFNSYYIVGEINKLQIDIYSDKEALDQDLDARFNCIIKRIDAHEPLIEIEDLLPGVDHLYLLFGLYTEYVDEILEFVRHSTPTIIFKALKGSKVDGTYECKVCVYGALTREQFREKQRA